MSSALNGLILVVGLNESYKSYFSLGFIIIVWFRFTFKLINIFFSSSNCCSTLNVIYIFFLELFTIPIVRVSS